MTRILRLPRPALDASVFFLCDPERRCPTCGRTPGASLVVTGLVRMSGGDALAQRYHVARETMRRLPPCDHGFLARCRARHARRHPEAR